MASASRRSMYENHQASTWRAPAITPPDAIRAFHRTLPHYSPTRLIALPQVAKQIGVGAVYLKDEGQRFGLPAFKILGASWAVFRTVTQILGLPLDADIAAVREALSRTNKPTTLLAATDGNHGRAVARMGGILGMQVQIYVPRRMDASTEQKIKGEGASVTRVGGDYDEAVRLAFDTVQRSNGKGVLIQDNGFLGYEEIPEVSSTRHYINYAIWLADVETLPKWIVEGYSTMMLEIDEQLGDQKPDLVITPVGVGSLAQAVVTHYKALSRNTRVLTVEADTAACLYKSLVKREPVTLENTVGTIMAGLDCGTVSTTAWPLLQAGVDASCSVSDFEAHETGHALRSLGVPAGPCGASPMAALRRLTSADKAALGLTETSVVVLLCTEGPRDYLVPRDVGVNDTPSLHHALTEVAAAAPGVNNSPGQHDTDLVRYISAWLEHRDIEASESGDILNGSAKDKRLSGSNLTNDMGELAAKLVAGASRRKFRL